MVRSVRGRPASPFWRVRVRVRVRVRLAIPLLQLLLLLPLQPMPLFPQIRLSTAHPF
jgi:hypothetical protein